LSLAIISGNAVGRTDDPSAPIGDIDRLSRQPKALNTFAILRPQSAAPELPDRVGSNAAMQRHFSLWSKV
jgi:hypothetical protein